MFYLKTYQDKIEKKDLDLYISLVRDIMGQWVSDISEPIEIPKYVYDHIEEYIASILSERTELEKNMLALFYQYNQVDGQMKEKIQSAFHMDVDEFIERCIDLIEELGSRKNCYYLKHGAYPNFPNRIECSSLRSERRLLKNQLLDEVEAYLANEDKAMRYLPEIMKKNSIDFEEKDNEENKIPWNLSLGEMDLSIRSLNCLRRAGIHTLGQLMELHGESFMYIRNLSSKNVDELETIQDEVRYGWFLKQDQNVFDFGFPNELIRLLLENGYFYWNSIKKDTELIGHYLNEAGLMDVAEEWENFVKEKEIEKLSDNQKVSLVFQSLIPWNSYTTKYYVELDGKVQDFFKKGAVLYPYAYDCLAVTKPDEFENMAEDMMNSSAMEHRVVLRHILSLSEYHETEEGSLIIRDIQIRQLWNYSKGGIDFFVFHEVDGSDKMNYLIQAAGNDENQNKARAEELKEHLEQRGIHIVRTYSFDYQEKHSPSYDYEYEDEYWDDEADTWDDNEDVDL